MSKPLAGAPGSGLHFHLSLTDAQDHAVFAHSAGPMGLSAAGLGFAAGLLHHGDALAALCAPTVNSYKRLAASHSASGTTWAPVWKAVGDNNRTCLLRTVAGRLEWRLPDPSCNVYIALAATLAAGLAGLDGGLPAPEACDVDLYERQAAGLPMPPRLPRDLSAALDALQADARLRADVGEAFCHQFLRLKREEWDAWASAVTDWELARYATA